MNPFATAALVVIAVAEMGMAWTTLKRTPEGVHFKAVQEYCKQKAKAGGPERYFACVGTVVNWTP